MWRQTPLRNPTEQTEWASKGEVGGKSLWVSLHSSKGSSPVFQRWCISFPALHVITQYMQLVLHEAFCPTAAPCIGGAALALPAQIYPLPRCTAIKAVGQLHLGIGKASTSSHPVPMACTHLAPSTHSPFFSRGQHHNSPCPALSQLSAAPACLPARCL